VCQPEFEGAPFLEQLESLSGEAREAVKQILKVVENLDRVRRSTPDAAVAMAYAVGIEQFHATIHQINNMIMTIDQQIRKGRA
jgi:uncharacterized coiled-coil DUF342 family protein